MNYSMMNHVVNHLLDVDSYGCLFMYATHQDLTTAPRHIIRMTEPVDPELLREALKIALLRFPQMGLGLVRGKTQYQYRKCVLFYYLKLRGYAIENDGSIRALETDFSPEENEDGFVKLRKAEQSDEAHVEDVPAFHLPEYDGMEDENELTTEITLPFSQVRRYVKQNDISPLTFLMTAICHAMYRTYYRGTDWKEAIVAEVPMDLRTYIDSPTVRFFVALLDLPFHYEYFQLPFAEACRKLSEFFDTQRALPHAAYWALKNAARVSAGHRAEMPIEEKEQMMREQARDYICRDSFILTNIGPFRIPISMERHIADYGAILPCAHQPFGILVSSYCDTLKISLSQRDLRSDLVNNLVDVFSEIGFRAYTYS